MAKQKKKQVKKKRRKSPKVLIELDLFFQIWREEMQKQCDLSVIKSKYLYRAYIKNYSLEEIKRRYIKTAPKTDEIIDLSLITLI